MTKPTNSTKIAPMVLPSTKPRNPFGVGANMAKAGSHQKSNKVLRQKDNKATKELVATTGVSNGDFSP